ncbi:MAG: hypothetical protein HY060_02830 [Proteobacteria bacterium]|nr:hypothetical protein [Pseudomonadota bacterium]
MTSPAETPPPEAGPAAPAPTLALTAELDALAHELELALSLVGQGQMLDLAGIDGRIDAACRAAQALPGPEARATVDRLGHLVALLDRLAAELLHHFGNLPQDADTSPRVAADAYGKGSGGRD